MAYNDCAFPNAGQLLRWKPGLKCSAAGTLLCVVLVLMLGFFFFNFLICFPETYFLGMRQLEGIFCTE